MFLIAFTFITYSQNSNSDSVFINKIYDEALSNGESYEWLDYLSNQIGGRLSGSINYDRSVKWAKEQLDLINIDSVWLQPVMVPKWVRGNPEFAYIETAPGETLSVNICALGGSVSTPLQGLKAQVVEVQGLDELELLGRENIAGKIVFFNRPMDETLIHTFRAYGGCVDQRGSGAKEAIKYGAVGVVVRSMNLRLDDFPHTGSTNYGDTPVNKRIPAAAISTNHAELLSSMLKMDKNLKSYFIL